MTSIVYFHLQYCHIHTDHVYASDHKKDFHRDDILTCLLITIMTKNHLNTDGVFISVAFSLIMIMLQVKYVFLFLLSQIESRSHMSRVNILKLLL